MKAIDSIILAGIVLFGLTGCDRSNDPVASSTSGDTDLRSVSANTFIYSVKGMSCGGCAAAVDTSVEKIDGVMACEVSLEEQKATVQLVDGGSAAAVEEAIRKLGYTVEPQSTKPAS